MNKLLSLLVVTLAGMLGVEASTMIVASRNEASCAICDTSAVSR